jgi:hypothetical protein
MSNMTNPSKSNHPGAKLCAAMDALRERDAARAAADQRNREASLWLERNRPRGHMPAPGLWSGE